MTDHRATVLLLCAALTALLLGVLVHAHATVDPEPGTDAARSTATATPLPTSTTAAPTTTTSTTTSSTTTTTEPVVVAAASEPILSSGHCGGHGDLIARYFPAEQVGKACAVVACESGYLPTAANPSSTARGLFQLMMSIHAPRFYARGWVYDDWADPEKNTAIAAELWREAGWRPWVCA